MADGLANDPAADRNDQSAFFQQRDEGVGRHQTIARVVPPQQRLDPDHPIVGKLDDRLVMQHELAVIERPPQLLGDRVSPGGVSGQRRLPRHGLARAARFGLAQCQVEVAQHVVLVALRRAGDDKADARRHPDAQIIDRDRTLHHVEEPVGQDCHIGEFGRRRTQHDAELVGAQPGHEIPGARLASGKLLARSLRARSEQQSLSGDPQHLIADADTVQIVDGAEAIEVDQQDDD